MERASWQIGSEGTSQMAAIASGLDDRKTPVQKRGVRWAVLLVAMLAACPAPRQYAVRRTDVECARAARLVRRTLLTLGYTVTAMSEPTYGSLGLVAGSKTLPDGSVQAGTVRIRCTAEGVEVQPVEDDLVPSDYQFSRAFRYSYIALAQRPDIETPRVAEGLQVLVEILDRFAQQLDLGGPATVESVALARITIRNGTDRTVALAADDLVLTAIDGTPAAPLTNARLGELLEAGPAGERVVDALLRRIEVSPHQTVVRFAVFPRAAYREARIGILDVETGETEGFFVPVQ